MSPRRCKILAAVVLLAGLAACIYLFRERANPDMAEDRDHPITDEERLVAAELVKHLPDEFRETQGPRFIRWGPHITRAEIREFDWQGSRPDAAVRVVFDSPIRESEASRFDWVFVITGSRVRFFGYNDHGDAWKEKAKEGVWPRNPPLPTIQLK